KGTFRGFRLLAWPYLALLGVSLLILLIWGSVLVPQWWRDYREPFRMVLLFGGCVVVWIILAVCAVNISEDASRESIRRFGRWSLGALIAVVIILGVWRIDSVKTFCVNNVRFILTELLPYGFCVAAWAVAGLAREAVVRAWLFRSFFCDKTDKTNGATT